MMKKTFTCLLLVLALLCGIAQAEEPAAYTPGAITQALFDEAFAGGKLVMADLSLDLDIAPELLDGEDAAVVEAVLQVLRSATLSVGASQLENGLLLTVAGTYAADPAQSVAAQVFLGVTVDGLWVETDVLPGERVTMQWETVLAMLGVDEATIEQIMSLRDVDLEQAVEDIVSGLLEELAPMLEKAVEVAAPYGQILLDFAGNVPTETLEDVPADDPFPAAKTEVTYLVTQKLVGELITALANQLEQDTVLAPIVDAILAEQEVAEGEAPMTTAALCEALRASAAGMTDEENPVQITMGMDENSEPLYFVLYIPMDEEMFTFCVVNTDPAAEGTSCSVVASVLSEDEEDPQNLVVSFDFISLTDPADENVCSFTGLFQVFSGDTVPMSMSMEVSTVAITTAESLPGYATNVGMSMYVEDGEDSVSMISTAKGEYGMTADGGEYQTTTGRVEVYEGETCVAEDVTTSMVVSPSESGPVAQFVETISMPDAGLNSMTVKMDMYTTAYEPDANLSVLAIESASSEDMEGLMTRLMTNGASLLDALMAQLPAELLESMTAEAETAVE